MPFETAQPGIATSARARLVAKILVWLVLIGIVASWVNAVILVETAEVAANESGELVMIESKTPLYYAFRALMIGTSFGAGTICVLTGAFRRLGFAQRLAFGVLFATAAVWALNAYTITELLSSEVVGGTGPFVWFMVIFVLAGMEPRVWRHMGSLLRVLAYISCVLALWTLFGSTYVHFFGFSKYIMYAILLMWLGGWTLLSSTRVTGWRLLPRCVPLATMTLMSVAAQSRSWTLLSLLVVVVFILLRSREQGSVMTGIRTLVLTGMVSAGVGAAVYLSVPQTVDQAVTGMRDRLDDDTRTGQYKSFFDVVPVEDLILGRGPKGTWYWRGFGDYQYFDNGYLWTLFIGGLPTLLSYIAILIWPAIRAARERLREEDAAAAWLVLFWALALTGLSTFTIPGVSLPSQLVCLCAGRCYLVLNEKKRTAIQFSAAHRVPNIVLGPAMAGRAYPAQRGFRRTCELKRTPAN